MSGTQVRPLAARVKEARSGLSKARAAEAKERRASQRKDLRLRFPVPAPDGERLPVMDLLDEALTAVTDAEPPMRDLDGRPVEIRERVPSDVHQLTGGGSNDGEAANTRLPAPALPLVSRHDRFSMWSISSNDMDGIAWSKARSPDRPVALPAPFIDHYMAYRESALPRVSAVVTVPLVLPDGTLLARQGLDRDRKLVFRIEPRLMELMPDTPAPGEAASALDFLANEWLCDVATDFAGKCVLIALALSMIERTLLPERPAFFVTAGKRGGGKTTALSMVVLAVTGRKPPAAAWAESEDERRKAVLAYLSEGLPVLVWDNIPLGTAISSPTIEKVLTSDTYSDRVLGETTSLTVPSTTIMCFTGNNISPKGDLASRSLIARIVVDQADPENRKFAHDDPMAWTLNNRGKILRNLYVVLRANPQLCGADAAASTRFKIWWRLVGSALESAARRLVVRQTPETPARHRACALDFKALFAMAETEDEATAGLMEVLEIFADKWPDGTEFTASEVAPLINDPITAAGLMADARADQIADAMKVADTLRAAMDNIGRRTIGVVSSKTIGRWLDAIRDAPVLIQNEIGGGTTWKLIRSSKVGKHAAVYKVTPPS